MNCSLPIQISSQDRDTGYRVVAGFMIWFIEINLHHRYCDLVFILIFLFLKYTHAIKWLTLPVNCFVATVTVQFVPKSISKKSFFFLWLGAFRCWEIMCHDTSNPLFLDKEINVESSRVWRLSESKPSFIWSCSSSSKPYGVLIMKMSHLQFAQSHQLG